MATIRLVPSTYSLSNTSLSVSNANNFYTNTDSTTYGSVSTTSTSSRYIYIKGFNFDDIPTGAIINSFSIKFKANESTLSTSSSYRPYLVNDTTTITGTANAVTTTVTTQTFSGVTADWETISGYGSNFGVRFCVRRSGNSGTGYLYLYGVEIEVDYTLPTYYTVTATSTDSNASISPASTQVIEGEDLTLYLTVDDIADVTVTDNDVDVTNAFVRTIIPNTGTLSSDLGTYTLVSGSFNGSGATYFSGIVGNGVNATQTTSNYYSGGSGTIAVFTYDMAFTNIPSNATITRVYCEVNGHAESTSNSNEYMCVQLISDETEITEEINFKSIGTSNSTVTLEAETLPTIAQLAALQLQCRLGYYGGAINGATCYVVYTIPGSEQYHYVYTLTNIDESHIILVETAGAYIPPEEDPEYTYWPITISSINATTDPVTGTTRVVEGTNQTITITPTDPQLTLALDNGVDITNQLVGSLPSNTYTVTGTVSGASYGFALDSSTGYYTSNNAGQANSAAVARLNLELESDCLVTISYINYAEATYDYGIFGNIDSALATTSASDSNAYLVCSASNQNTSSVQTVTYNVTAGTHFIDIKYRKDQATDSNNDNLQWKVTSIEATGAGGNYTYTLTNITQKHSLIFVFGNVSYYFITSSGTNCRLFPDGQQVKLEGDSYKINIVPDDISYTVSLTDNSVMQTLERMEGQDKSGNTVVSYSYSISNVQAAHTLVITCASAAVDTLFVKLSEAVVEVGQAYQKVNGVWVEVRANEAFSASASYVYGGNV